MNKMRSSSNPSLRTNISTTLALTLSFDLTVIIELPNLELACKTDSVCQWPLEDLAKYFMFKIRGKDIFVVFLHSFGRYLLQEKSIHIGPERENGEKGRLFF